MSIDGEYEPSTSEWVSAQVGTIMKTGTTESVDIKGLPVILMTMVGAKSGKVRKVPVMRVEHDGVYAAVASKGGAPENPAWYGNLQANADLLVQDGREEWNATAREISGEERQQWWQRCVEAFSPYADYQKATDRTIPVLLLERSA